MTTHRYSAHLSWAGSTGAGYESYDRTHTIDGVAMSADPAFRGDPSLPNPEQLLLAAAASCQLLSFLAVAARARIDVLGYTDEASAVMPEDDPPTRITSIVLRPRIRVRAGPSEDRVRHLVEVAHRECFIANSLRSSIAIDATIEWD